MGTLSIFCAAVVLSLLGCGGSNSSDSPKTQTPASTPAAAPTTISQAIAQAESSGKIPTLNRDDTVAGPTTNGVRTDIAGYINSLPDTAVQKKAMLQEAATIQLALTVDTTSQTALLDVDTKMTKAINCLYTQYGEQLAQSKAQDLEKVTVNTATRFAAYEKFNNAMSGKTSKLVMTENDCKQ
ncbi:hypothetical protein [Paraburkholderia youngii]|uniref:hypothetical protein n=1 Tax=Paraburkholderia youngii TaxID=2782701 RepID=UPI003D1C121A